MDTVLLNISHLAFRALESSARQHVVAERRDNGTWDVLMSDQIASALNSTAQALGLSVSDLILSTFQERTR